MPRVAGASRPSAIPQPRAGHRSGSRPATGFSLVELLVVLGIVVLLLGMLMPGLREVREAARRLQCGNHMRMIGVGILAYGVDQLERLPYSRHAERKSFHDLMALTVSDPEPAFDGLGLLLPYQGRGYVDNRACFFCPSHCGEHEAEANLPRLHRPGPMRIFGNYHYRGHLQGETILKLGSEGDRLVLLTDGLRTRSDFSHLTGTNLLRSDGSVRWWYDAEGSFLRSLPVIPAADGPDTSFEQLFNGFIDRLGREAR